MRWANLIALWALLAVPLALFLYARASRGRLRSIRALGDFDILAKMSPALSLARRRLKAALTIVALGLLVSAMARPQVGTGLREIRVSGRDVIFALDVSASMLAQDLAPSRIEAAKNEVAKLIDRMKGDRVGLVIFAGNAFMQCPLTGDNAALRLFLDTIKVGSVPRPGTNMADAITESGKAFAMAESRAKIIVLLTDGEDFSGNALDSAKEAAKSNIQIYTIGIGRAGGGAPIPIRKEDGSIAYKQDAEGKTIMSALDEETLQKIALETGGKYYYGGEKLDLSKIYAQIAKKQGNEMAEDRFYTHYEDRYQWLLVPALLLLLIEVMIGERRRRLPRLGSPAGIMALILVLPLLMAFGGPLVEGVRRGNDLYKQGKYGESLAAYTEAQITAPEDPRLHYNIGDALYKQEKHKEAREAYQKVLNSQDASLKERAYYNIGNCYVREGQAAGDIEILSKAVESYEKALELDPDDQDAKYNLEVVRKMIELKKKEQPPQNQQQQPQNQQPQPQEQQNTTQEQNLNPQQTGTAEQQLQQQQGTEPKEMSREEAQHLLRALEDRERKNLEEREAQAPATPGRVLKDW